MSDQNLEIAKTILDQMGGMSRLVVFVGARNFVAIDNGVRFKFKGCSNINLMEIKLNSMDTYDVSFIKQYSAREETKVKKMGIYDDGLKELFERTTNLYLSLGG